MNNYPLCDFTDIPNRFMDASSKSIQPTYVLINSQAASILNFKIVYRMIWDNSSMSATNNEIGEDCFPLLTIPHTVSINVRQLKRSLISVLIDDFSWMCDEFTHPLEIFHQFTNIIRNLTVSITWSDRKVIIKNEYRHISWAFPYE